MPIIQYFSDLHLEDGDRPFIAADADVICILGDLGVGRAPINWIDKYMGDVKQPIIVIPGNHEFYYHDMYELLDIYRAEYSAMGVDFLYNDSLIIGDTKFIGTTLWTDFDLHKTQVHKMLSAPTTMSDYTCIFGKNGVTEKKFITPQDILKEHQIARAFIARELASLQSGHQAVVLTHHAPHSNSLAQRATNQYAPFYASDLSAIIAEYQPALWLHGHIHEEIEYWLGETMVLGNPRGRNGHPNSGFHMDMTIKI